jgi:hypothetical protein
LAEKIEVCCEECCKKILVTKKQHEWDLKHEFAPLCSKCGAKSIEADERHLKRDSELVAKTIDSALTELFEKKHVSIESVSFGAELFLRNYMRREHNVKYTSVTLEGFKKRVKSKAGASKR